MPGLPCQGDLCPGRARPSVCRATPGWVFCTLSPNFSICARRTASSLCVGPEAPTLLPMGLWKKMPISHRFLEPGFQTVLVARDTSYRARSRGCHGPVFPEGPENSVTGAPELWSAGLQKAVRSGGQSR